jgi:uncharacterized RDD family membrane protein YckC
VSQLPPPGWYPDTTAPGRERWWDGRAWSHVTQDPHTQPTEPYAPQPYAAQQYPPQQYPYAPGKPPTTPDGEVLASWGRRAAARLLDYLILSVIVAPLAWGPLTDIARALEAELRASADAAESGAMANVFTLLMDNEQYTSAIQTYTLIFLAVTALYEIVFTAMRGATPGKSVVGLRVRRWERPGHPSWGASVVRWAVQTLPIALPGPLASIGSIFRLVDLLFPLWDSRRQTLHDKAARTVVVRIR